MNEMNNNVITEQGIVETADKVIELYPQEATDSLADYAKLGGACLVVVVGGYLTYKYAIKPAIAKRKAKKAEAEKELDIVAEIEPSDVDVKTDA